ncbi:MAG: NGG1p interacting factor NIF3 [Euryarchaeota archaeon]|nr:NGG1p interacting factor NIF3 [Euryarchaeota archaeon]
MQLIDLYRLAIQEGMAADPRQGAEMSELLEQAKQVHDRLEGEKEKLFDADALWNPYADSRIVHGDPNTEVRSIMWGIDINTPELLLADRLREKGRQIDAVIGHHPRGRAGASLHRVMDVQEDMMESWGVPITTAECLVGPRAQEVMHSSHAANHARVRDAAALLDIPLMCLHQPADLLGQRFMEEHLERESPTRVRDVIEALLALPEYQAMARECNPPEVFAGDKNRRAGAIAVKFAGGTSSSKDVYEYLARAGTGTVVCMHVPKSHIEEAKKHHINIVVASHMASDSLGTNLIADKFEEHGITIIPCSGFIRVRRK